MKQSFRAFSLPELIVVVMIITILGTIGIVSYTGYSTNARDSVRLTDIQTYLGSLNTHLTQNGKVPLPDDLTTITASGSSFHFQGTIGPTVIKNLGQSIPPHDPKTEEYYLYATNKSRTRFQLLTYLEEEVGDTFYFSNYSHLDSEYSGKSPHVDGDAVGILIQEDSTPLSAGTFDLATNTQTLHALYTNEDILTFSDYTLLALMYAKKDANDIGDCPLNYIYVPGNDEFNTRAFCIAQYEMSHTTPMPTDTSTWGTENHTFNTVPYDSNVSVVSAAGNYPIGRITNSQALAACQSLGQGYYLPTNAEWMTIARSIEANPINWSGGVVGRENIFNGLSSNSTLGCSDSEGGNNGSSDWNIHTTFTGPGADTDCNEKRTHTLVNGEIIWDFAGNVWEHVNKTNQKSATSASSGQTVIANTNDSSDWDSDGLYDLDDMKLYGAATQLGSDSGFGSVFDGSGEANNMLLRGGSSIGQDMTGIYSINLRYGDADPTDQRFGFRCAHIK